MFTRVTSKVTADQFLQNDMVNYAALSKAQEQESSGKRIQQPEDDPFGTAQSIEFTGQLADINSFQSNVQSGLNMMQTSDSALSTVMQGMRTLRTLVVQASNGTNSPADLANMAAEVSQIKESIRSSANARFGDVYVFSGTATSTQPYAAGSNTYAGNNDVINRRVAPGQTMPVNVTGSDVFGTTTGATPADMNVFDLIDQISADMTAATPASIQDLSSNCLSAIDARSNNITQQQAIVGSSEQRLQGLQTSLQTMQQRIMTAKSDVENIDVATAAVNFQQASTTYQATLQAGSQMLSQKTLLDFLS